MVRREIGPASSRMSRVPMGQDDRPHGLGKGTEQPNAGLLGPGQWQVRLDSVKVGRKDRLGFTTALTVSQRRS